MIEDDDRTVMSEMPRWEDPEAGRLPVLIVLRGGRPTFVVAVEERHAHGDFSADV